MSSATRTGAEPTPNGFGGKGDTKNGEAAQLGRPLFVSQSCDPARERCAGRIRRSNLCVRSPTRQATGNSRHDHERRFAATSDIAGSPSSAKRRHAAGVATRHCRPAAGEEGINDAEGAVSLREGICRTRLEQTSDSSYSTLLQALDSQRGRTRAYSRPRCRSRNAIIVRY